MCISDLRSDLCFSDLFSIGDLTFLSASFRRLRNLLEGLLSSFSTVAGQALYLDDLFSFFEIKPEIPSPADPRPFPYPIREGFVFGGVVFRYSSAERSVGNACVSTCRYRGSPAN